MTHSTTPAIDPLAYVGEAFATFEQACCGLSKTTTISPFTLRAAMSFTVSPPGSKITPARFTSIQAAIDEAVSRGANGQNPAVINVNAGTYTENIVIPDGIIVDGTGVDGRLRLHRLNGTVTFDNVTTAASLDGMYVTVDSQNAVTINANCTGQIALNRNTLETTTAGNSVEIAPLTAPGNLIIFFCEIVAAGIGVNYFANMSVTSLVSTINTAGGSGVAISNDGSNLTCLYSIIQGQVVSATSGTSRLQFNFHISVGVPSFVVGAGTTMIIAQITSFAPGAPAYLDNSAGGTAQRGNVVVEVGGATAELGVITPMTVL